MSRPRVATPDSAIGVSLVSTLGGGAYSVRKNDKDISILKDKEDVGTPGVLASCPGVWQVPFFVS